MLPRRHWRARQQRMNRNSIQIEIKSKINSISLKTFFNETSRPVLKQLQRNNSTGNSAVVNVYSQHLNSINLLLLYLNRRASGRIRWSTPKLRRKNFKTALEFCWMAGENCFLDEIDKLFIQWLVCLSPAHLRGRFFISRMGLISDCCHSILLQSTNDNIFLSNPCRTQHTHGTANLIWTHLTF